MSSIKQHHQNDEVNSNIKEMKRNGNYNEYPEKLLPKKRMKFALEKEDNKQIEALQTKNGKKTFKTTRLHEQDGIIFNIRKFCIRIKNDDLVCLQSEFNKQPNFRSKKQRRNSASKINKIPQKKTSHNSLTILDEKEYAREPRSFHIKLEKYKRNSTNANKMSRSELAINKLKKKFGKRFFKAYVHVKRCSQPRLERSKSKSKNLSVSFREHVEVLGDGNKDENSPKDSTTSQTEIQTNSPSMDLIKRNVSISPLKDESENIADKDKFKLANEMIPPQGLQSLNFDEVAADAQMDSIEPLTTSEKEYVNANEHDTAQVTEDMNENEENASHCEDITLNNCIENTDLDVDSVKVFSNDDRCSSANNESMSSFASAEEQPKLENIISSQNILSFIEDNTTESIPSKLPDDSEQNSITELSAGESVKNSIIELANVIVSPRPGLHSSKSEKGEKEEKIEDADKEIENIIETKKVEFGLSNEVTDREECMGVNKLRESMDSESLHLFVEDNSDTDNVDELFPNQSYNNAMNLNDLCENRQTLLTSDE